MTSDTGRARRAAAMDLENLQTREMTAQEATAADAERRRRAARARAERELFDHAKAIAMRPGPKPRLAPDDFLRQRTDAILAGYPGPSPEMAFLWPQ